MAQRVFEMCVLFNDGHHSTRNQLREQHRRVGFSLVRKNKEYFKQGQDYFTPPMLPMKEHVYY